MGNDDSMKKKLIFVISRMSIGGSQKSLVNALKILDFDKYDVKLYVRENKTDLLSEVSENVEVVVNTNTHRYEHTPYALFMYLLEKLFCVFGNKRISRKLSERVRNYIVAKKTDYEKKHYGLLSEKYDIAISYLQGFTCKFTDDCIDADRKICFFHNSTDALPEIHKEYLHRFEKVVVVSEQVKLFLAERYPEINDRLIVIKNLLDIERIKKKAKEQEIKREEDRLVLCTCGRISKEKGYDLAVDAAKSLKDCNTNFQWYFVGSGPEYDNIREKINEYGLGKFVIMTGSRENPYPWISQCDIYVQPSYEEAQPLSIMEAQILLKPIVSTDTVGGQTVIDSGNNGLLVDINGKALSDGILYLSNNPGICKEYKQNLMKADYHKYNLQIQKQWEELLAGKI